MKQIGRTLITILLLGGVLMVGLIGCGAAKYHIDYNGQKDSYRQAPTAARAGSKVTVCYDYRWIGTDTDYSFYLDGERLNATYKERKGFVMTFEMPKHDVQLVCRSVNSMVRNDPVPHVDAGEEVMLVDYQTGVCGTDGFDHSREYVLYSYSDSQVKLMVYDQPAGGEETETAYLIPYYVAQECYDLISQYNFAGWESRGGNYAIDGGFSVCKYFDGEKYIRVSTGAMPFEDGEAQIDAIGAAIAPYITDEYKQ